jgi:hypothetical protein
MWISAKLRIEAAEFPANRPGSCLSLGQYPHSTYPGVKAFRHSGQIIQTRLAITYSIQQAPVPRTSDN